MEWYQYGLISLAALLAGLVNALAGGGTLISFPVLVAVGLPAVAANVNNTVSLVPGYLGAAYAQRKDLLEQKERLIYYLPAALAGGIIGGILLLFSGERLFRSLIPYLILLASVLLALSDVIRGWVGQRSERKMNLHLSRILTILPIGLAAVYGGYFGAGLSVVYLAVLGIMLSDSLIKLNALKQTLSFVTNTAAAVFFLFSGQVIWPVALVMAVSSLVGGILGGKLAGRVKPSTLRWLVVGIGFTIGLIYLFRS